MRHLRLQARAKINLFLRIGGRRADGFHSLRTEFQEISLADNLEFRLSSKPGIHLTISGRKIPGSSENIVVRALTRLQSELKTNEGMTVRLTKDIPIGAGLGGGSSDAAAALWGGWLLWNKRPPTDYRRSSPRLLLTLAAQLGADVSFFIRGGRARATGKGEKLIPCRSGLRRYLVVAYPRVHVSTAEAYRLLDQSRRRKLPASLSKNDFEPVIFKKFPTVRRTKEHLEKLGCTGVQMSGSGSAVFGFVASLSAGRHIRRQLLKDSIDAFVAHTL